MSFLLSGRFIGSLAIVTGIWLIGYQVVESNPQLGSAIDRTFQAE